VLFDRLDPASLLWSRRQALLDLLAVLNDSEISDVWKEDETIGWVYQYFNSHEERRQMRAESQAPRNSRELAVRNQFFTPRYVVEFLTDNTLGRIWYEMRQGDTALKQECKYLVRRPREVFLLPPDRFQVKPRPEIAAALEGDFSPLPDPPTATWDDLQHLALTVDGYAMARALGMGDCGDLANRALAEFRQSGRWMGGAAELWCCLFFEQRRWRHFGSAPEGAAWEEIKALYSALRAELQKDTSNLSQEELLKLSVYVPYRAKKDPRDIKILDPACGSGHFLLYTFDLLLTIYEEGWEDVDGPKSEVTGKTLRADFASLADLRSAMPGLILRHNLYGIDIDPRCVQIAALALWMRAQRAFNDFHIVRGQRAAITKTNIVVAEPMPGEKELREEFIASLDKNLRQLVERVFDKMTLAGEAGSLLKIEDEIRTAIREIYIEHGELFQKSDEERWREAERRLLEALRAYAERAQTGHAYKRRLFAEDAAHGFAFIDICRQRYDTVLMNPPFGSVSEGAKELVFSQYGRERIELGGCFVTRFRAVLAVGGRVGAIANRTLLFAATLEEWRSSELAGLSVCADLGHGVLDALVETAAFICSGEQEFSAIFFNTTSTSEKEELLRHQVAETAIAANTLRYSRPLASFKLLHGAPFAYWVPPAMMRRLASFPNCEELGVIARSGLQTCDNFRFLRLRWEIDADGGGWIPVTKGGEYEPFWADVPLYLRWESDGRELKAYIDRLYGQWSKQIPSSDLYGKAGLTYSERTTSSLSLRVLPPGCVFDKQGPFVGSRESRDDPDPTLFLLGLSYTTPFRFLVETGIGLRDATSSGSPARHYLPSLIQRLPLPATDQDFMRVVLEATNRAVMAHWKLTFLDETCVYWRSVVSWRKAGSVKKLALDTFEFWLRAQAEIYKTARQLETMSLRLFEISDEELPVLMEVAGASVAAFGDVDPGEPTSILAGFERGIDELIAESVAKVGSQAAVFKKSYWGDRRIELICLARTCHPLSLLSKLLEMRVAPNDWQRATARQVVSVGMGISLGRLTPNGFFRGWEPEAGESPFLPLPRRSVLELHDSQEQSRYCDILVDDPGHAADVVGKLSKMFEIVFGTEASPIVSETVTLLGGAENNLRNWVSTCFFSEHLSTYSMFRRRAPIYWQLATPSATYSLWLYYHRFTNDTFYKVLNDYIAPKLEHEERKLTSLLQTAGGNPTASQRKEIPEQEAFVEELRTFREEVARIAPLWNPDLNDGVIINFAPLWRLVPQHRAWQKECKDCWDRLVADEYDWSHLAMHLWPERVMPKCAEDRSLAIAHGLEEVFWVETSDGKWQPRKVDKATVEKLIAERISPAVKDALHSLLNAPAPGAGRGSGRRQASRGSSSQRSRPAVPDSRPNKRIAQRGIVPDDSILDALKQAIAAAEDGASKADIIGATRLADSQWNAAINELLAQGVVTKAGERRAARYHLVKTGGDS
jgi:23S rRNA G2445 N2-methylase RlmL